MRRSKNTPDAAADSRPKLTIKGVGAVLGVSTSTMYKRLRRHTFSVEGIPVMKTRHGNLYDMEAIFKRLFPSADDNTIAGLMYDYMQKHRGLVK